MLGAIHGVAIVIAVCVAVPLAGLLLEQMLRDVFRGRRRRR